MKSEVRSFILDNFLFTTDQGAIKDSESLIERGIIDSTGVLEVVSFVEEKYGVEVLDEEMIPENLDSVDSIVAFVTKKQG